MNLQDIFNNPPVLETSRLILRKITYEDAYDIFEYASDPEMTKYVVWDYHKCLADSYNYISFMLKKYENREPSTWGIVYKSENKFIGTCGFLWCYPENASCEIGYALSRKYWNKGIVTESVKEIIKLGFDKMMLNRIEARCMLENTASQRVLQKVGMTFEGIMRQQMYFKGAFQDLKVFSILRSDYYK